RGAGDDELRWRFAMDALTGLAEYREMLANFGGAAARQDGDEFFVGIEVLLAEKRMAIERGAHRTYQRMADKFYGDPSVAVELFFKRKDAEGLREAAADYAHAPGSPGPELRADIINVSNAAPFEFAGEAEMEAGKVGEDSEGGLAALGFGDEAAHGTNERGKVAEDFGDADDGDFGVVGDDVDAGGAHLRAAHAENLKISALLQRGGEAGGVHVSAGFTGGEQKRDGRHEAGKRSVAGGNWQGQWRAGLRT